MSSDSFNRLIGGTPGGVLIRLIFLSLIVGAIMSWWGITPEDLYYSTINLARDLINQGFASLRNVGMWVLYGAVVVIPIWILLRVLRIGSGR